MAYEDGDKTLDYWYDRDSNLYFMLIEKHDGKWRLIFTERHDDKEDKKK